MPHVTMLKGSFDQEHCMAFGFMPPKDIKARHQNCIFID